jgi:hypothetical protein
MPQWRMDVANIFYLVLTADTEEEACRLAQHRINDQRGHEQRVPKVERIEEARDE